MEKTVYFRAFEEEDAQLIHQWKNDDVLNALSVGLNKRTCYEEDLEWVRSHMRHHPYSAFWAICSKETNHMIGWACLTNIHYINSSAETGAIVIGDPDYRDGFAWVETVLFMFEYAFERLGLNRLYGQSLLGHYDVSYAAILKEEYFAHKEAGDYEMQSVIRRLKQLRKAAK